MAAAVFNMMIEVKQLTGRQVNLSTCLPAGRHINFSTQVHYTIQST